MEDKCAVCGSNEPMCVRCEGLRVIKVERARAIGYTRGDDSEIIDEHLEPCPECCCKVERSINDAKIKLGGKVMVEKVEDIIILSPRCPFCNTVQRVEVPEKGFHLWKSGTLIQNALPTLTADEREALITGVCANCFPGE